MSSYLVRPATAADTRAVADLARRVRRELRLAHVGGGEPGGADLSWVVEAGRRDIVGSCSVAEQAHGAWRVTALYLAPEWRGFGLGRALLANAVRAVEREGGLELALAVLPECLQAETLARALGFEQRSADDEGRLLLVRALGRAS